MSLAWRNGAKSKSHEKQVTQKTPPKRIPALGRREPCPQNFRMDLHPKKVQSVIDQKIFYPDWTLRPEWKVVYEGVATKRRWEHVFIHKKTGGEYEDMEITRYRGIWEDMSEAQRQGLSTKYRRFAPDVGSGGGFAW